MTNCSLLADFPVLCFVPRLLSCFLRQTSVAGKVFLNSVEYLDPETMEWTTYVNRCTLEDARSETGNSRRASRESNLQTVDEQGEMVQSIPDSSDGGCDSDEHSS